MSILWTAEMSRAVTEAGAAPAHVEVGGEAYVLLAAADADWVRGLVPGLPEAQIISDPRTQARYELYPAGAYERINPLFEGDTISAGERKAALRAAGLRAGWNDPVWDDPEESPGSHEAR